MFQFLNNHWQTPMGYHLADQHTGQAIICFRVHTQCRMTIQLFKGHVQHLKHLKNSHLSLTPSPAFSKAVFCPFLRYSLHAHDYNPAKDTTLSVLLNPLEIWKLATLLSLSEIHTFQITDLHKPWTNGRSLCEALALLDRAPPPVVCIFFFQNNLHLS